MKYILTDETNKCLGYTLHRIKCIEAFGEVKVGEKGGWVESEKIYHRMVMHGSMAMHWSTVMQRSMVMQKSWIKLITSNLKIGGQAADISPGHGLMICGG